MQLQIQLGTSHGCRSQGRAAQWSQGLGAPEWKKRGMGAGWGEARTGHSALEGEWAQSGNLWP